MKKILAFCLAFLIAIPVSISPANAEVIVRALEKDKRVAVLMANKLAIEGAQSRGTCVAYYSGGNRCSDSVDEQGYYMCKAGISKYKSSCKGGSNLGQRLQNTINEITQLCNENPDACSAVAAAIAGG